MLGFTNKQFGLALAGAAAVAVSRMAKIGNGITAGKEGPYKAVSLPTTVKGADKYDAIWIVLPAAAAFVVNKYL